MVPHVSRSACCAFDSHEPGTPPRSVSLGIYTGGDVRPPANQPINTPAALDAGAGDNAT
ncbi:MAG: hypothetical protein OXL97_11365 [Chloroflexota bacterium]|nr:hypothetical protein [Chloroflexota bacterium]